MTAHQSYAEFLAAQETLASKRVKITEIVGFRHRLARDPNNGEPIMQSARDKHGRVLMDRIIQDFIVEGGDLVWAVRRASRWVRRQYRPGRQPPSHIRRHIAAWAAADQGGFRNAIDRRHDELGVARPEWTPGEKKGKL